MPTFDQNRRLGIQETFEIKHQYETGHAAGLVVVLDERVTDTPSSLIGKRAVIYTSDGRSFQLDIDDARDHLATTSVFFTTRKMSDVPVDSQIEIV